MYFKMEMNLTCRMSKYPQFTADHNHLHRFYAEPGTTLNSVVDDGIKQINGQRIRSTPTIRLLFHIHVIFDFNTISKDAQISNECDGRESDLHTEKNHFVFARIFGNTFAMEPVRSTYGIVFLALFVR